METYINEFVKLKESQGLCSKALKRYKAILENFCQHISKPSEIKEKVIMDYYSVVEQQAYTTGTKSFKMGTVKAFCEYLITRNKLIVNTKCLLFSASKTKALPKDIWSEVEIDQLISSLKDERFKRLKAIIELSYSCGLRLKEVINADLFDLNLEEATLLIRESKCKDRLLPVNKKAMEAIQEYLQKRKKVKLKTTALFVNNKGQRMNENDIQSTLYGLGMRKQIGKKLTIHGIRNSIATHLLRRGMDIVLISKFLGHNHLTTTTIYCRVVKNDLKAMIDRFHPRNSYNID